MKVNTEKTEKEISQIDAWKKEYGRIFKSVIDGKDYIWRRIKRKEYSSVMAMKDGADVDERIYNRQFAIAKLVVLNIDSEELERELNDLAGLATTISEEVMEKSGFNLSETTEL